MEIMAIIPLGSWRIRICNHQQQCPRIPIEEEIPGIINECQESVEKLKSKHTGANLRDFSEVDLKSSMGILSESSRRYVCT